MICAKAASKAPPCLFRKALELFFPLIPAKAKAGIQRGLNFALGVLGPAFRGDERREDGQLF